jgi:hypothetical protein
LQGGSRMRKVEIVKDRREQRCWLAKDIASGEVVLRLHERGLLERICNSLEWKVVHPVPQYGKSERS